MPPPITMTCSADCNGAEACRPNCASTHRSHVRVDSGRVSNRVEAITWMNTPERVDLLHRITRFIAGQSARIELLLGLKQPADHDLSLCGSDIEIAAVRNVIDTSVSIIIPSGGEYSRPADVITYRRHVAASTLRYAEWHAQQAAARFEADACRMANPFRVSPDQISTILDRHIADPTMRAIDPHGELRQRWQDVRVSRALVNECQAASACLEQFAQDHALAAMDATAAR